MARQQPEHIQNVPAGKQHHIRDSHDRKKRRDPPTVGERVLQKCKAPADEDE